MEIQTSHLQRLQNSDEFESEDNQNSVPKWKVLINKQDYFGKLTQHHPLDLIKYLWKKQLIRAQIDPIVKKAEKELDDEVDQSEEMTSNFHNMETARH